MKRIKIGIFLFLLVFIAGCSHEEPKSKPIVVGDLDLAKQELRSELDSMGNPITKIKEDYLITSKVNKDDIDYDMELGYERMKSRFQLLMDDKLSEEEYWNDINGAFEEGSGFKTEIGKKISKYYKEKHFQRKGIESSKISYEKYVKIMQLKNKTDE